MHVQLVKATLFNQALSVEDGGLPNGAVTPLAAPMET